MNNYSSGIRGLKKNFYPKRFVFYFASGVTYEYQKFTSIIVLLFKFEHRCHTKDMVNFYQFCFIVSWKQVKCKNDNVAFKF